MCFHNISTHILTKRMTMLTREVAVAGDISTHILTKRMTAISTIVDDIRNISTHILTKRMTKFLVCLYSLVIFQLTSSRRGWPVGMWILSVHGSISTHILTKRMTKLYQECYYRVNISTHILTKRMTVMAAFQSALSFYFNSHPHEEDDR